MKGLRLSKGPKTMIRDLTIIETITSIKWHWKLTWPSVAADSAYMGPEVVADLIRHLNLAECEGEREELSDRPCPAMAAISSLPGTLARFLCSATPSGWSFNCNACHHDTSWNFSISFCPFWRSISFSAVFCTRFCFPDLFGTSVTVRTPGIGEDCENWWYAIRDGLCLAIVGISLLAWIPARSFYEASSDVPYWLNWSSWFYLEVLVSFHCWYVIQTIRFMHCWFGSLCCHSFKCLTLSCMVRVSAIFGALQISVML